MSFLNELNDAQQTFVSRKGSFGERWESGISGAYSSLDLRGATVLDGGASVGLHTVPLASHCGPQGRVIAVEANPDLIPRLEEIKRAHGWAHLEIRNVALSNASGRVTFYVAPRFGYSSLFNHSWIQNDSKKIEVEAVTIDQLIGNGRLDFVKLDLEGGEFLALSGAVQTIARERTIFALEFAYYDGLKNVGVTPDEFWNFWAAYDYELVGLCGLQLERRHFQQQAGVRVLADYIFALPRNSAKSNTLKASIPITIDRVNKAFPAQ